MTPPRVSIGLPVYNGGAYLDETIDSLLAQTFGDFELIISDNGSTDATERLCRERAAGDERIRYVRHAENRGAAWNHNFVALEARAPYFKWNAADDLCAAEFVERSVAALEADAGAVLSLPGTVEIDERGETVERWTHRLRVGSPDLIERWRDLLMIGYECYHVYGVIRREALMRTGLVGSYIESDMVLLAELSLHGHFAELEEPLFRHRLHPGRSVSVHASRYDRAAWFDTAKGARPSFPTWRFLFEYAKAIRRAPLSPAARRACLRETIRWAGVRRRDFARDIKASLKAVRGPVKQRSPAS